MDGRIYFRSQSTTGRNSLKELTYTSDNSQTSYQPRLFGKRHYAIKKNAKLQKSKWKNMEQENNGKLRKLFDICMSLIVHNLDIVDSFYGLPSLIGQQIFQKAVSKRQFSPENYTVLGNRIGIFAEAYGDEMFQTLNLCGKQLFVAHLLDELTILFPYLHSVRLSDCGIGDEHEILLELGKSNQLKYLSLDNNKLGDTGVKNLLQRYRRQKQGLNNLENLNLSKNKNISFASLSHVSTLPSLQAISIDATKEDVLTLKRSAIFSMQCLNRSKHVQALKSEHLGNDMINGWGSYLLESWINDFKLEEDNRMKKAKTNAEKLKSSFYKINKKDDNIISQSLPVASQSLRSAVTLCLCHSNEKPRGKNAVKRKLETIMQSNLPKPKKSKKISSYDIAINEDDSNLLDLYS